MQFDRSDESHIPQCSKDGKISLPGTHLGTTFLLCISATYNPMSPINRIQAANNLLGRA